MTKLMLVVDEKFERKCYISKTGRQPVRTVAVIRIKMIDVKGNYKNGNEDLNGMLCTEDEDTTEHVFECKKTRYIGLWKS